MLVSTGSISTALLHTLGLPAKKPYEIRHNKYTNDNVMYTMEFAAHVAGVDRRRLRFLDEMGSDSRATGRKLVRWPRGHAAHVGTPGPRGEHLTTTGITCIRADQPALIWDVHEGGHTADYHREWMLYVAEGGGFAAGDILVVDNWSGHVGEVGQQLERELLQEYGVVTLPLPRYSPELNPIELTWATVKQWMRRFPRGDLNAHLFALGSSLNAVDHGLVGREYAHRGY